MLQLEKYNLKYGNYGLNVDPFLFIVSWLPEAHLYFDVKNVYVI